MAWVTSARRFLVVLVIVLVGLSPGPVAILVDELAVL